MAPFNNTMLDLWPRGFFKEGLNYDQIFSPIIKPDTVWIMLTIALAKGWKIRHFGFDNGFLNGHLSEDVLMSQPEGFAAFVPHLVCKLQKP